MAQALAASTTQVIPVGPMLAVGDGITPVNATLTIASIIGEMHMTYRAGTAPGIVTFTPTSTATYTIAGAMAEIASASGMFSLVLTPTLTAWRGWGKLSLRAVATMLPYWDNVFCGTSTNMDGYAGSAFLPVNAAQLNGATATAAGIQVNATQLNGVTATAAYIQVDAIRLNGVTATSAMIQTNATQLNGVTATAAVINVNVTDIASTGSALTAVPWNVAWAANINAEMVDALNTDEYGELAAVAPSVSVPMTYKIGFLYKLARNKTETTATTVIVYQNDAVTAGHKAQIGDDGVTFTKGEFGAP
jgi:hypothetical protein